MDATDLNIPLLIAIAAGIILLLGFLVYRNLKDEEEYEEKADDPHSLKRHQTKDQQEKRI